MTSNLLTALTGLISLCLASQALTSPVPKEDEVSSEDRLLLFARLLAPLREISLRAGALENMVEKAAEGDTDMLFDAVKRQGAWDMDYGWGGGRFGKRGNQGNSNSNKSPSSNSGKRYDMYGISGRFGRDVSRVQAAAAAVARLANTDH